MWDADQPAAPPAVFWSVLGGPGRVTTHLFHAIREGRGYLRAPLGCLYTADGAYRADAVLAAMWSCPESVALRGVPKGGARYSVGNLAVQEAAQAALDRLWAAFLDDVRRR